MPLPRRSASFSILAAASLVAVNGLAACSSETTQQQKTQLIRNNLTPELDTMYQRPDDIDNAIAITFDENGRMFNEDLGRFWLLDRPSRLTREPSPRP